GEDPRRLKTRGLRERINKARRLLEAGDLRRPTRQSLNDFMARDRAELQNRQASQQVPRAERQARQLLRGPKAQDLRLPALSQRIDSARSLLGTGELTRKTQRRLDQLLASDLAVLKARQAQQQQPSRAERRARRLLDGAPASSQLDAAALRERINTARKLLQSDELRRRTRRDLNELVKSDRTALAGLDQQRPASRAERDARDLLASSISPQQMKTRALRQRIRDARALLQEPDVRRRTRNRLQERVDQDVAELRARQGSQTQSSAADDQARELLSDRRAAAELNERQLRRRLRETRDLLQDQQLSRRLSRRLRQQLSLDRRELRRRLEARRLRDENIVITQPRGDAAALLNDRRGSHSLRTKALSRRIKATQRVLNGGGLNNRDQPVLADLLRSDRRELRQRLRNRRDRRRAQLERQRRNNELNIVIAPRLEYAPRDDVAAAEADDQIIERQLVAPPTRRIERRYTLEEFRRQPELRSYMPAIEVDSIHFGFNEHWVREEEIDELERIGSVIERVVAANPDEVFLIEGHTDAVGSSVYNLDLSRKRADAVRNALVEYFVIPRENLAPIGYGERFLKIPTPEEEQENRRVSVRRITPLLASR
ncbi:MAG: OmpA family protein, partial [Aestuariivirgaceae bacterium]